MLPSVGLPGALLMFTAQAFPPDSAQITASAVTALSPTNPAESSSVATSCIEYSFTLSAIL